MLLTTALLPENIENAFDIEAKIADFCECDYTIILVTLNLVKVMIMVM